MEFLSAGALFAISCAIGVICAYYFKRVVYGSRVSNLIFSIFGVVAIWLMIFFYQKIYLSIDIEFKMLYIFISVVLYILSFVILSKKLKV